MALSMVTGFLITSETCFFLATNHENGKLLSVLSKKIPYSQPNLADEERKKKHVVRTIHIWNVQQMK
jgi:hypothetical protein